MHISLLGINSKCDSARVIIEEIKRISAKNETERDFLDVAREAAGNLDLRMVTPAYTIDGMLISDVLLFTTVLD